MSLFDSIVDKIVHYASNLVSGAKAEPASAQPAPGEASTASSGAISGTDSPLQSVDIGATLSRLAEQNGQGLHWQSSIVDLLKLLGLDSSLQARQTLAGELNVHAGETGSAEQNIALHQAVVQKLAAHGGKWPG
ncbi:DUF3597 domain-containing protein [Granulibacter bethesdensis]|uniref:DUF3597 domain-containing protein n=1 Tax=Granulibacter bethesdensis TaxID=364410 RepID=UPI0003F1F7DF|nr:DUF3597 domain-containing protein [Granulibacter bethesdensis]APG31157.1 Hypothetical protein GbCGDNIH4_1675 [Granulibacter bethesdensis CGDNIH4]